jgi:hypothetical protein
VADATLTNTMKRVRFSQVAHPAPLQHGVPLALRNCIELASKAHHDYKPQTSKAHHDYKPQAAAPPLIREYIVWPTPDRSLLNRLQPPTPKTRCREPQAGQEDGY